MGGDPVALQHSSLYSGDRAQPSFLSLELRSAPPGPEPLMSPWGGLAVDSQLSGAFSEQPGPAPAVGTSRLLCKRWSGVSFRV